MRKDRADEFLRHKARGEVILSRNDKFVRRVELHGLVEIARFGASAQRGTWAAALRPNVAHVVVPIVCATCCSFRAATLPERIDIARTHCRSFLDPRCECNFDAIKQRDANDGFVRIEVFPTRCLHECDSLRFHCQRSTCPPHRACAWAHDEIGRQRVEHVLVHQLRCIGNEDCWNVLRKSARIRGRLQHHVVRLIHRDLMPFLNKGDDDRPAGASVNRPYRVAWPPHSRDALTLLC